MNAYPLSSTLTSFTAPPYSHLEPRRHKRQRPEPSRSRQSQAKRACERPFRDTGERRWDPRVGLASRRGGAVHDLLDLHRGGLQLLQQQGRSMAQVGAAFVDGELELVRMRRRQRQRQRRDAHKDDRRLPARTASTATDRVGVFVRREFGEDTASCAARQAQRPTSRTAPHGARARAGMAVARPTDRRARTDQTCGSARPDECRRRP